MALPNLPSQGQNPWYEDRQNWDEAVKAELEGRLSDVGLSATFRSKSALPVNLLDYAEDNGSNQALNIQAAIDAVPPRGTLEVPPGRMFRADSDLVINKEMTIFSSGGGGFYSSVSGTTSHRLIRVESSNVRLRGLVITGPQFSTSANQFGVSIMGSVGSVLSNVSVIGCDISKFAYAGVYAQFSNQIRIDGNRVSDIGYAGIMVASCIGGSIESNQVQNITQATGYVNSYGITASRTPGTLAASPRSSGISIRYNRISDVPLWVGIDTHGGQGLLIEGNLIRNTGTGISLVSAQDGSMTYVFAPLDMIVRGNLIDSTVTNGTRGAGINLSGNTVRGHGLESSGSGGGIYLENTLGVPVGLNTVIEGAPTGIVAYGGNTGFTIVNNTVIDQWSNNVNTKSVNLIVDNNTGYIGENTTLTNGKTATYTAANGFGVFVANQPNNLVTLGMNRMAVTVNPLYDPGAKTRAGFFGASGAAKAVSPGVATGSDAAVVNAIVTALRNYGLMV